MNVLQYGVMLEFKNVFAFGIFLQIKETSSHLKTYNELTNNTAPH